MTPLGISSEIAVVYPLETGNINTLLCDFIFEPDELITVHVVAKTNYFLDILK